MTWINDGEKYGMVGLSVKTEGHIPTGLIAPSLWVMADTAFEVPSHWKEWLGSIRAEQIEDFNLFLLSKAPSANPDILDDENNRLKQLAWLFYVGLLLASTFAPAHQPIMLTGVRRADEIDIREQRDFNSPIPKIFLPYPPVVAADIQLAAKLAGKLEALPKASLPGGHWRLLRTLNVYTEARTTSDILDRIHQYSRCIDGLILPDAGKTKQQFKSRTELFIGSRHHDLMGDIYDIRSAVEHLHENRYLESFDRAVRLDLIQKEAIVEYIARTTLARTIEHESLWTHFANTTALARFVDARLRWSGGRFGATLSTRWGVSKVSIQDIFTMAIWAPCDTVSPDELARLTRGGTKLGLRWRMCHGLDNCCCAGLPCYPSNRTLSTCSQ